MHSARHVHQVSYRYHATLHQWASGLPTLRLSAVPRCSVRSTDDDWASLFASEDTKEFSFAFQVRTRARCYTMMATSAEVSTRLCLSACPPTAPLPYVNILATSRRPPARMQERRKWIYAIQKRIPLFMKWFERCMKSSLPAIIARCAIAQGRR